MLPSPQFSSPPFHHHQPPPPPLPPPPFPPPQFPQSLLTAPPPTATSLWNPDTLHNHLRISRETLSLLKAVQKELETILALKKSGGAVSGEDGLPSRFCEAIERKGVGLDVQEARSLEIAKSLCLVLKDQIAPLVDVSSEGGSWEERSEAVRFMQNAQKRQRNKKWKKKKRRRLAEMIQKKKEMYDKADQEADEWRAKEIAKDIAKSKMEKMKEVAKLKAKEERKRLESEMELFMVVERLQELRSIRMQKLKKQGHFFPEQDDEFLARVRAAVEEEERQVAAAADTDAAKDAIASAEISRKVMESTNKKTADAISSMDKANTDHDEEDISHDESQHGIVQDFEREGRGEACDTNSNLPLEFYHYYHGSNYDMGTLIEVRRSWDAFIRPGGSRIPGHWIQPPPPGNDVWASYLVSRKQ